MHHFRLPAIVTGIVVGLALIVGIAGVTSIYRSADSDARKLKRSQQLGEGVAIATLVVITPFWLIACGKVGKKRREERERARAGRRGHQ
jgi:ABC-type Fe3+-siderophore transport system permease subunit